MVGFSWFLTRSSIQVQAWPVHQTRPNRGVGLRRLGPWPRRHRRPKPLLHKVDRPTRHAGGLSHCQNGRVDEQAVSLTAKMADSARSVSLSSLGRLPFFPSVLLLLSGPARLKSRLPFFPSVSLLLSGPRSPQSRLTLRFSFTSFSRPLPLSERWAESIVRREEGRRRTSLSTTNVRTIYSLLHLPTHM